MSWFSNEEQEEKEEKNDDENEDESNAGAASVDYIYKGDSETHSFNNLSKKEAENIYSKIVSAMKNKSIFEIGSLDEENCTTIDSSQIVEVTFNLNEEE